MRNGKTKRLVVLIPFFGSLLFIVLYILATYLYPGGSQVNKNAVGFSWINNYWCNLLNENAVNGKPNPAKPVAITGMCILCLALTFFWFLFSKQVNISKNLKLVIEASGIMAMVLALLLFTNIDHDLVTNLASIFGLVATIGVFIGLYKKKWSRLLAFGLCNILLVALNNYLYYSQELIVYLPVVQKISFAAFLIWICWIDLYMFRETKRNKR